MSIYCPAQGPPRLIRLIPALFPDGSLAVLDERRNFLMVSAPLFEGLTPIQQERCRRTTRAITMPHDVEHHQDPIPFGRSAGRNSQE
jgi:hypothetical protein